MDLKMEIGDYVERKHFTLDEMREMNSRNGGYSEDDCILDQGDYGLDCDGDFIFLYDHECKNNRTQEFRNYFDNRNKPMKDDLSVLKNKVAEMQAEIERLESNKYELFPHFNEAGHPKYGRVNDVYFSMRCAAIKAMRESWKGVKRDWANEYQDKYCIRIYNGELLVGIHSLGFQFLSFRTRQDAENFLNAHSKEDIILLLTHGGGL